MLLTKHELTEGEKKCLEEYEREKSPKPRKNLIRLVRHMNFANPLPDEKSWEYIFFDRQLNDAQVDFALKMKLRHPYTIKELATVEKMSVEDTAQMAYDLCYIGLLEYCNDPGKEDMVQLPVFAPGAMESTVMTKERTDRYPETAYTPRLPRQRTCIGLNLPERLKSSRLPEYTKMGIIVRLFLFRSLK